MGMSAPRLVHPDPFFDRDFHSLSNPERSEESAASQKTQNIYEHQEKADAYLREREQKARGQVLLIAFLLFTAIMGVFAYLKLDDLVASISFWTGASF